MTQHDLRFGSPVVSSDGCKIGTLERIIVDHESLDPHSIVVREDAQFAGLRFAPGSWYLSDELVVPMTNIGKASADTITLNLSANQARRLRPYLSYRYRAADVSDPTRTFMALSTGGPGLSNLEEVAAKTAEELELANGENVMLGRTGRLLGHVREVVYDEGELVGVVLHPKGLFQHNLMVPVRFLGRSDDLALFLDATEEDLEKLQPIHSEGSETSQMAIGSSDGPRSRHDASGDDEQAAPPSHRRSATGSAPMESDVVDV